MRLVIDGRRLTAARTGVGRYLESLLHDWAETGPPRCDEAVVVLHDRAGLERVPRTPAFRAVLLGEGWPGAVWERFALRRVLRPGDLLFAPANVLPQGWHGQSVVVIHDAIMDVRPALFTRGQRLRYGWHVSRRLRHAVSEASRVLVPSRTTARDIQAQFHADPARIQVVPLGVDPVFQPLAADSTIVRDARRAVGLADEPFFLFVGKRSHRRNVHAVLAAFDAHRVQHPGHSLVFVGPGTDRLRTDPARGLIVAGHVAEPVLRGLFASAQALVYPSLYEGFGLPMVEAMASGCPVIALRHESIAETAGEAAHYLDEPTAAAIANALASLAHEGALRERLVRMGLARAADFTRSRFAATVRDELNAAADSLRHSRPTRAHAPAQAARASRSP